MAALQTAEEISDEVYSRVSQILIANGFETDVGRLVFRGRRVIDDDLIPCAVVIEGAEDVEGQVQTQVNIEHEFLVHAYLPCEQDHPNTAAHKALRDLKRALFTSAGKGDWTWGRRVKAVHYRGKEFGPRADGAAFVLCVVAFAVEYVERLDAP